MFKFLPFTALMLLRGLKTLITLSDFKFTTVPGKKSSNLNKQLKK
jgi:hypothetical protein